ncbi:hypothetical protein DFH09DRAFT_1077842 [Mycena vulgaris]|nr:hypothetical protein DFH09DRAFT_1077842 [Mycena vulgaris]
MASTLLKKYFWRGEKQNSSMYHTYCKACVAHHLDSAGTTTADLAQSSEEFKEGLTLIKALKVLKPRFKALWVNTGIETIILPGYLTRYIQGLLTSKDGLLNLGQLAYECS